MKRSIVLLCFVFLCSKPFVHAQGEREEHEIINAIIQEAEEHSQLETLAYELLDGIGPRLVGSSQMQQAHDWAIEKFSSWGIHAENQQWGLWRGWERGTSTIELVHPRVKSLEGTQLAFSPATPKGGTIAEVIILPEFSDSIAFKKWLPEVKGKFVMISMYQPIGRPLYNLEEFATPETFEKLKNQQEERIKKYNQNIENTGYNLRYTLAPALEKAGAAGIIMSYWSNGFGVNKIFDAKTKKIPTVDLSLEDYGQIYRMIEHGEKPQLKINASSKETGMQPSFNTIATIKGTELPDEYILLSAHIDSWDGGTGATDNGTGVIAMMEAARILKKLYPNPKRTIIIGLWGSEEQGLNGSRAFVKDHPEIVKNISVVFNQDNGTGRISRISGQGFLDAYDFLGSWLAKSPKKVTRHIQTDFPGYPSPGSSDHAPFVAAGVPAFYLGSLHWAYRDYTWHTNRDTYDKIIFDEVVNNVIVIASLTYWASEDLESASRRRINLKIDPKTDKRESWPEEKDATRKGGIR